MNRHKKITLLKSIILSITMVTGSISFSGCGKLKDYYIVTDNKNNYICTMKFVGNEDYEYRSIVDDKYIGDICTKRGNFDYNNHRLSQKFLNEFQVIPLEQALSDEGISYDVLENNNDIVSLAQSDVLDDIVSNHYVRKDYNLEQNFVYTVPSKLQIFVHSDGIKIGYDVSPDREFHYKNKYIYSISDKDVIEYVGNDVVDTYSVDMYLTDEEKNKGYVTYNRAIEITNNFTNWHGKSAKMKLKK